MARITKTGWVMPHGNTKIKDGYHASQLMAALNEEKFSEMADMLEVPLDVAKNIFASAYEMEMNKKGNLGLKPMEVIEKITRKRGFTSAEEMAFSNMEKILKNTQNWSNFKKLSGIKNMSQYDPDLWHYDAYTGEFIYDNLVSVMFAGNYHDALSIDLV